jgi:hypothetical protein
MSLQEIMIANTLKHGTTQRFVPQLSVKLSSAKAALTSHGRGRAGGDAAFLLEWLEQTPISAKHLSAKEIRGGGIEAMMGEITSALQFRGKGGAERLEGVVGSIIKDDAVARQLLVGNVTLDSAGARDIAKVMGTKAQRNIQGVDIKAATSELMRSMDAFESSGGLRLHEQLSGRGARLKAREIPEVLGKVAAQSTGGAKGMFAEVSRKAMEASNLAVRACKGIIKHHKAIGLGFAGSLALGAVLSSPPQTVGPGSRYITGSRMNMNVSKGAQRLSEESQQVHPPGQALGNPTVPAMMNQRRASISSGTSRQVSVRGRAGNQLNLPGIGSTISSLFGGNTSGNMNIRDNRSPMDSVLMGNKLL